MKTRRHFTIREIINQQRITTQEELCEALKERGHNITQATVSRDIKELSLLKVPDDKGYRYALSDEHTRQNSTEQAKKIFQESVIGIRASENLIVVHTTIGAASSVGLTIDTLQHSSILGNVAGDDTVIVVIAAREQTEKILVMFNNMMRS